MRAEEALARHHPKPSANRRQDKTPHTQRPRNEAMKHEARYQ